MGRRLIAIVAVGAALVGVGLFVLGGGLSGTGSWPHARGEQLGRSVRLDGRRRHVHRRAVRGESGRRGASAGPVATCVEGAATVAVRATAPDTGFPIPVRWVGLGPADDLFFTLSDVSPRIPITPAGPASLTVGLNYTTGGDRYAVRRRLDHAGVRSRPRETSPARSMWPTARTRTARHRTGTADFTGKLTRASSPGANGTLHGTIASGCARSSSRSRRRRRRSRSRAVRAAPRRDRPTRHRPPEVLGVASRAVPSALRGLELARIGEGRAAARRAGRRHRLAVDADRVVDAARRRGRPGSPGGARSAPRSSRRGPSRPEPPGRARPPRAARTPSMTFVAVSPGGPAAQVLVLADDDLVERGRGDRAVLALVLVAPVARDADDADRPARSAAPVAARADPPGLRRPAPSIIRFTKSASWRIPSTLWQ